MVGAKEERYRRREKVRQLWSKGIYSQRQIAEIVGANIKTIVKDVASIRMAERARLTKKEGMNHLADVIQQLEGIAEGANTEVLTLPKGVPRSGAVKSALWQTAIKATVAKAQLLFQTGVMPTDVSSAGKIVEAEVIQERSREVFNGSMAGVAERPESRRKVLDYVESLKTLDPESRQRELEEIEKNLRERELGGTPG